MRYAECLTRSNCDFLTGASHPEELVWRAAELDLAAIGLADADGLHGVVKAHLAAKEAGIKLLVGARLTLDESAPVERYQWKKQPASTGPRFSLAVYAQDLGGYRNLCELVSRSRLAHPKGEAGLPSRLLAERAAGLVALLPVPCDAPSLPALAEAFGGRLHVGVCRAHEAADEERVAEALRLAARLNAPLLAHNDVHTHLPERQPLQDVITAIRHGVTLEEAGTRLFSNGERTLKGAMAMGELFADLPRALEQGVELARGCSFSLDQLKYEFSQEELPPGHTAMSYLKERVEQGLHLRYPSGVPRAVRAQIAKEEDLIAALDFPGYFLALWDIVRFARSQGILCQGRGSAANSAVCYALQITSIDPVRMKLLFERFLSMERKEPPDIDVDFEHQRREEVIQYVYDKHGRHRSGMVAELITYRGRSAVRDVGKALGLSLDQVDRLARTLDVEEAVGPYQLKQAGLSPLDPKVRLTLSLAQQLKGAPRHLSIHVGGFVITHGRLSELVPLENGRMKDRTVCQWDKDDLSHLDILKVDLLGLGMLTVISRTFALLEQYEGLALSMATVPAEDPAVYDMLCEGDAIGVFQIESRAQQNMLPRLKPRSFYDLVIEIAIIRPGPIVGDMVHPFLRRRNGEEPVSYPSPDVKDILERTLGVPLFQEQAMKLAMVAAGFTPGEADGLRRAISNKRAEMILPRYRERFIKGCLERGYPQAFAEKCFKQFDGFAQYGFPESHSASFALIAYCTAWLKRFHPAAFTAALLDAQPMGFYAVHTLVEDAKRHGVVALAPDVSFSGWKCELEPARAAGPGPFSRQAGEGGPDLRHSSHHPLRLGLELVKGLREETAHRIEAARAQARFTSVGDLARRARVPRHELARLALAGALSSLCASRRAALWELAALGPLEADDLFYGLPMNEEQVELPPMSLPERVNQDWDTLGLSVEMHPVKLLRPQLDALGATPAGALGEVKAGQWVKVGGLAIVRQRPPTAKGFTFLSVEDETGIANLVIEPQLFDRFRKEICATSLVVSEGYVERAGKVVNLKVRQMARLD